jgi:hypothetical protein
MIEKDEISYKSSKKLLLQDTNCMLHTANRNKTKLVELAVNCDNGATPS